MNYIGVIIEESLHNASLLDKVKILKTKIEKVTDKHKTPWVSQWTLHTVEVDENIVDQIAMELSNMLDREHSWYADFENEAFHYIIYKDKVFKVDRTNPTLYEDARKYGIRIGIPDYQVNFAPHENLWGR